MHAQNTSEDQVAKMSEVCIVVCGVEGVGDVVKLPSLGKLTPLHQCTAPKSELCVFLPAYNVLLTTSGDRNLARAHYIVKERPVFMCALPEPLTAWNASFDSRYLLGGSKSGAIFLWELPSGRLLRAMSSAHSCCVTSVCFSPDLALVVTGSEDGTVTKWSLPVLADSGQSISPLETSARHTLPVRSISFGPLSNTVISASMDRTLRIGSSSIRFPSVATSILVESDEKSVIVGCRDGCVWRVDPGSDILLDSNSVGADDAASILIPQSHNDCEVTGLLLVQRGSVLVTSGMDGKVRGWDHISGHQMLWEYSVRGGEGVTCCYSSVIAGTPPTWEQLEVMGRAVHPLKKFVVDDDEVVLEVAEGEKCDSIAMAEEALNVNVWEEPEEKELERLRKELADAHAEAVESQRETGQVAAECVQAVMELFEEYGMEIPDQLKQVKRD